MFQPLRTICNFNRETISRLFFIVSAFRMRRQKNLYSDARFQINFLPQYIWMMDAFQCGHFPGQHPQCTRVQSSSVHHFYRNFVWKLKYWMHFIEVKAESLWFVCVWTIVVGHAGPSCQFNWWRWVVSVCKCAMQTVPQTHNIKLIISNVEQSKWKCMNGWTQNLWSNSWINEYFTSCYLMYGQFDAREIPSTNIATETIQSHSPAQRHLQNNM